MKNRKLINFIIFIPFAISIGAFILYLKYLFTLKGAKTIKITELMEVSLVRYRNIAIFCLLIGVILLFIKTIYEYFKIDKEIKIKEENALTKISNKKLDETNKYSFDENEIISDLLGSKNLKAVFINSNVGDRVVKFKRYDKDKNVIEFFDFTKEEDEKISYTKKEYIVKEKVKKKNVFNPIKFALNMILILLCIILLLLCFNKIKNQSEINRNNFNINNIKAAQIK